ncbi:MAG: DUF2237 domain-containing protein [Planctomycetota bacterium]
MIQRQDQNVLGGALAPCCTDPMTGYFRDGHCRTVTEDVGSHTVCAEVTAEFLEFSRARGNDLVTPYPTYGFPGLKPGDKWCLCASRWYEAYQAGVAPAVVLEACHARALDAVPLEALEEHALGRS